MIRSKGHCNTMGTASTMALVAEALGTIIPGSPARRRPTPAARGGARDRAPRRCELVADDRRPSTFLTTGELPQRDRRARRDRRLDQRGRAPARHRRAARHRPDDRRLRPDRRRACRCWSTCSPPGSYLMDDLYRAGGFLAVLREVRDLLDPTALTITGTPARRLPRRRADLGPEVITPRDTPLLARRRHRGAARHPRPRRRDHQAGRGIPAPAQAPRSGRRVRLASRTSTPASTTPTSTSTRTRCMVLRGCGPKGYPGMPEVANMPLPKKLLEQGVRDMVRICDGRMSGTAYGTVVLHVTPEAAAGGPLALVQTGDWISLDVRGPPARPRGAGRGARRAHAERRRPSTASRTRAAAGSGSTSTTCCRPTRAPTSTSSSDPAGSKVSVSRTEFATLAAPGEELLAALAATGVRRCSRGRPTGSRPPTTPRTTC